MDTVADDDDQRLVEIGSLVAIFPELQVDPADRFTVVLEVPVKPDRPVTVSFSGTGAGAGAGAKAGTSSGSGSGAPDEARDHAESGANAPVATYDAKYLPSLTLRVTLPPGYPEERPPQTTVLVSPPWLPDQVLRRLEQAGPRFWEEASHDMVVFTYIDHVQQEAESLFGLAGSDGEQRLALDPGLRIAILDYDAKAQKAAFDQTKFYCGVCMDSKMGLDCHSMQDCGHVFCVECLQSYYGAAIASGDLAVVRCLEPGCVKSRQKALAAAHAKADAAAEAAADGRGVDGADGRGVDGADGRGADGADGRGVDGVQDLRGPRRRLYRPKTFTLSPGELLQIPLDPALVQRYVDLKYKAVLEADKDTVYCPRSWCGGAARSPKRRVRPRGLAVVEDDDADEDAGGKGKAVAVAADDDTERLLCICEDCGFAFCRRCRLGWHGAFQFCRPARTGKAGEDDPFDQEYFAREELASLLFVALNTAPCPTCGAATQKSGGCNHMTCFRCGTHFCYLCSTALNPDNPYAHYNSDRGGAKTACFNRLWELEDGGGTDIDLTHFDSAAVRTKLAESQSLVTVAAAAVAASRSSSGPGADSRELSHKLTEHQLKKGRFGVEREAPLVLRIAMDPVTERENAEVEEEMRARPADDYGRVPGQRPPRRVPRQRAQPLEERAGETFAEMLERARIRAQTAHDNAREEMLS